MSALDPRSLFSLEGQVAIITGAASGMGRATAEAMARAGAGVVLAGLGDVYTAADALRDDGLDAIAVACDLTAPEAAQVLVRTAVRRWGRLDTVFANAGFAREDDLGRLGSPDSLEGLDAMFDLHVRSVLRLADSALPSIADTGGGLFLVMSSLSGLRGNAVIGGYGVTKAANAQIARNLAVQWGHRRIRANALAPGVIATDFATPITADPELAAARLAKTPLRRFGTAAEVAGAVVWLASPAGAFVSGQTIVIDGGTLASD
nr:SDR family oxidoreductase [uncultured Microbacterium sp.]